VGVRACRPRPAAAPEPKSWAKEVIPALAEIRVGENETFESALRRFNKKIQQSGFSPRLAVASTTRSQA